MKQIYSFAILFCTVIFANNTNAQTISQNFNSQTEVDQLVTECWSLTNIGFTATNPIEGAGQLIHQNPGAGSSVITTPELNVTSSLSISFSYKGRKNKKITISLLGTDTTTLEVIDIANTGILYAFSNTYAVTAGNKRIRITTDGNTDLEFDLFTINAPYTYIGGCNPTPIILPIKLNSFAGNLNSGKVNLNWSVSANETGEFFEVEKSNNGSKFEKAATVIVTEKAGNENYGISFTADAGNTHYFRLKVINKDGSVHYSKVLSFTSLVNNSAKLKVLQNPIVNGLSFNYQTEGSGTYQVSLYAASGLKISTTQTNLQKGSNLVSLDVTNNLPKGIYILEVSKGIERTTTTIVK